MSNSINRVTVTGNLGDDPRTGESKSGRAWASIRLACNRSWKDAGGQARTRTDWFPVVAFNGLAKSLSHLAKGDQIAVDGHLQSREYTDGEGKKRTVVEIVAEEVQFLRLKDRPVDDGPAEPAAGGNPPEDDDIPF